LTILLLVVLIVGSQREEDEEVADFGGSHFHTSNDTTVLFSVKWLILGPNHPTEESEWKVNEPQQSNREFE
jgi:hypothetical protein